MILLALAMTSVYRYVPSSDMYTNLTCVIGIEPFFDGSSVFCAWYQHKSYIFMYVHKEHSDI